MHQKNPWTKQMKSGKKNTCVTHLPKYAIAAKPVKGCVNVLKALVMKPSKCLSMQHVKETELYSLWHWQIVSEIHVSISLFYYSKRFIELE